VRCSSLFAFVLVLLLAACGSLPRPFEGHPGATAARLAEPPAARLAIPPPSNVLPPADAASFAQTVAAGLLAQEVPVIAAKAQPGDWQLLVATEGRGSDVVPLYRVLDPAGAQRGITEGLPVAGSAWVTAPPVARLADEAIPRIAALLSQIEADRRQSDPRSLTNRAPILAITGVTGAPGDGNEALARQIKVELVKAGQDLTDRPPDADFRLAGEVTVVASGPGKDRVEIQWVVTDAKGGEAGRVVQLNEVPHGMVSLYWGDVAYVVAQEAAPGVRDVIAKRIAGR
jgi:hypothetical protein